MKTSIRHSAFASIFLSFCLFCCYSGAPDAPSSPEAPRPTVVNLSDSAAFFASLRKAFAQKDADLLSSLMADHVRSGYLEGAQGCSSWAQGCPKAELIRAAFRGADAEGWTKFGVVWRMGFARQYEAEEFYLGPSYPGLEGLEQRGMAYIFADQVQVRTAPDKNARVLTRKSRCWVTVDTDMLCYDEVPEDWLPVIIDKQQVGYVYIHLTSWSRENGFIIVKKDAQGQFRVVEMNYFDTPPGTWFLPGCCDAGLKGSGTGLTGFVFPPGANGGGIN